MVPQLNWGGPGYAEYQGYMKVSGGEKKAAGQQTAITTALQNQATMLTDMAKTQFAEQQSLLNNTLIPQLTAMATNPEGFGAEAMAAMRSQAIGTIGTQTSMQLQRLQNQFATQNLAGLQSGVQQALKGQIGLAATGQEATALQNLDIANAQAKMQQQQFALSGLGNADQLLGQAPQAAGLATSALTGASSSAAQSFQQQYTMAQQGGFWSNFARGIVGSLGTIGSFIPGPIGMGMKAAGSIGGAFLGGFSGQGGGGGIGSYSPAPVMIGGDQSAAQFAGGIPG